ncbi:uncharacterized protein CLUP02_09343 [Colletotrichum lupini]|uniref:Uncharacterized protein n=1 Tax=Colletotrichum lupini TaxID=145971 RepID=A0A9Q8SUK0_9PEZI|nr:uncharacterized protein CLUP02_09343 [Colletotrichum lupini]UQC83847.1 hypothetical protein CLUP02_09343 [Colletotrichum lupini]
MGLTWGCSCEKEGKKKGLPMASNVYRVPVSRGGEYRGKKNGIWKRTKIYAQPDKSILSSMTRTVLHCHRLIRSIPPPPTLPCPSHLNLSSPSTFPFTSSLAPRPLLSSRPSTPRYNIHPTPPKLFSPLSPSRTLSVLARLSRPGSKTLSALTNQKRSLRYPPSATSVVVENAPAQQGVLVEPIVWQFLQNFALHWMTRTKVAGQPQLLFISATPRPPVWHALQLPPWSPRLLFSLSVISIRDNTLMLPFFKNTPSESLVTRCPRGSTSVSLGFHVC